MQERFAFVESVPHPHRPEIDVHGSMVFELWANNTIEHSVYPSGLHNTWQLAVTKIANQDGFLW